MVAAAANLLLAAALPTSAGRGQAGGSAFQCRDPPTCMPESIPQHNEWRNEFFQPGVGGGSEEGTAWGDGGKTRRAGRKAIDAWLVKAVPPPPSELKGEPF